MDQAQPGVSAAAAAGQGDNEGVGMDEDEVGADAVRAERVRQAQYRVSLNEWVDGGDAFAESYESANVLVDHEKLVNGESIFVPLTVALFASVACTKDFFPLYLLSSPLDHF